MSRVTLSSDGGLCQPVTLAETADSQGKIILSRFTIHFKLEQARL